MPKPLPPPWDRFVPFAQKIFVWSMVFGVLWFLRSFFFLVFLVFVFGYVMQHGVLKLEPRIQSRRLRVVVVFLLLLATLVGLGWAVGPEMAYQAKEFPRLYRRNLVLLDQEIVRLREESPSLEDMLPKDLSASAILAEVFGFEGLGGRRVRSDDVDQKASDLEAQRLVDLVDELALATIKLERLNQARAARPEEPDEPDDSDPDDEQGATDQQADSTAGAAESKPDELTQLTEKLSLTLQELTTVAESQAEVMRDRSEPEVNGRWKPILPKLISVAGISLSIGSAFLLSLLFSFLIVLDFPNLARGARHLHDTRLQFVYDEISDSVFHFGRVLGQALEAQLMIAIINTALTATGLAIMGVPSIAFLSTVVFVCSFIPVAGVFISSVPICLTALAVDGIGLLVWALVFITIIHMIEAYILNPRIYGAHLRMNPVVVLAILVMSHHLFGIWGLILGVPVVNYAVNYVIHGKQDGPVTPAIPATGELE